MKKLIYIILLLAATNTLHAQGFLNKIKNKIAKKGEKQATAQQASTTAPASGVKYTDPAQYGTLIKTYSQSEVSATMGGGDGGSFDLWFQSVKVVNGEPQLKIADYNTALYSYTNSRLQNTGEKPDISLHNKLYNGSEKDLRSIDFTENDQARSLLKNGAHIAGGMVPGTIEQTYTFNGKVFGSFAQARIAHNADSTVIAGVGANYAKGLSYNLITSNGQHFSIPSKYGGMPLISPDGKISAAAVQSGSGTDVYVSNGSKFSIGSYDSNTGLWLRNSGSVFYIDNGANTLYRNGQLYHTFEMPVNTRMLFISADDKSMCWEAPHAICFSDGTIFENASSPSKVIIGDKEVILFLTINVRTGELYLCRHDL